MRLVGARGLLPGESPGTSLDDDVGVGAAGVRGLEVGVQVGDGRGGGVRHEVGQLRGVQMVLQQIPSILIQRNICEIRFLQINSYLIFGFINLIYKPSVLYRTKKSGLRCYL